MPKAKLAQFPPWHSKNIPHLALRTSNSKSIPHLTFRIPHSKNIPHLAFRTSNSKSIPHSKNIPHLAIRTSHSKSIQHSKNIPRLALRTSHSKNHSALNIPNSAFISNYCDHLLLQHPKHLITFSVSDSYPASKPAK